MSQNIVISSCLYFFEILVKQFLELEMSVKKESGLLSIFKKIDYSERSNKFKLLENLALEAKDSLPIGELIRDDAELYTLNSKLLECYSLFISMTDSQNILNHGLNKKTQGGSYPLNEYNNQLQYFDMTRNALESELPKLQSLFASYVSDPSSRNTIHTRSDIRKPVQVDEEVLIDLLGVYIEQTDMHINEIKEGLVEVGFAESHFEDDDWMYIDSLVNGVALDSMSFFNLLSHEQAEAYYSTMIGKFIDSYSENEDVVEYLNSEFMHYRKLIEQAKKENIPPFDYVYSKLLNNYLGEHIDKYNINFIQMTQTMVLMSQIYIGNCKKVLEHYKLIDES